MVKPEIAKAQLEIEKKESQNDVNSKKTDIIVSSGVAEPNVGTNKEPGNQTIKRSRFFGHVETDATRFFRTTDDIEKEVLKHLTKIKGSNVKITIHIDANNENGFDADTQRTLNENGKTLGFGSLEFE